MLADWHTDTVLIADTLERRHPEIVRELEVILAAHDIPLKIVWGTADIWIRDAAPVQVGHGAFVQFTYHPDYLQGEHERLITGPGVFANLPGIQAIEGSDLVIDGGNVVGVPGTAILTDKVYRENRTWSRDTLRAELQRLLSVDRLIIVPKEPYDSIGHADGMVRFVDDSTVVVNDYARVDPDFGDRLTAELKKHDLRIVRIPYRPENNQNNGIDSAVGNYANFLRVRNLVIVPAYGMDEDAVVMGILEEHCRTGTTVVPLPCFDLARGGGVLQCVTWTVKRATAELQE